MLYNKDLFLSILHVHSDFGLLFIVFFSGLRLMEMFSIEHFLIKAKQKENLSTMNWLLRCLFSSEKCHISLARASHLMMLEMNDWYVLSSQRKWCWILGTMQSARKPLQRLHAQKICIARNHKIIDNDWINEYHIVKSEKTFRVES